ncbi:hypothetical protein DB30_05924 [Enhygromyxa salina]|uniref:YtkA-like domain-containing protein n=2 Tax=Enhygromyxa salina TaxID=215803 RepID=A0A0C2DC31_9BACT|nr:hypothetical protein DB30_05924 [Enhygromyxa salina]
MFACDSGDAVGKPCETAEDCDQGLICDVHDGQGTCQEDHGHEDGHEDGHEEGHEGEHEDGEEEGCAAETRADTYAVGLSKSGSFVTASFVSADPAPPVKGDNSWVLSFSDADGEPLDGLEIVVTPMMPDHGHGTAIVAEVSPTGTPGEYDVAPVNLHMTGYWEIAFDVTAADQQDSVMFGFCVE